MNSTTVAFTVALVLAAPLLLPWRMTHGVGLRVAKWLSRGADASTSANTSGHSLFFATTKHVRVSPVGHSFVFPVVYLGFNVGSSATDPFRSIFFAHNALALLSVWNKDLLVGSGSLRERVMAVLRDANTPLPLPIGRILLVTAPRVLGLPSFNPLNVYYCHDDSAAQPLRAIILEVNNTFGERHLYVLDGSNRWESPKKGFHSSYEVQRSFFVSPFNNRSGVYETHISDMTGNKTGVLLIIKEYAPASNELLTPDSKIEIEPHSKPSKHLIASVEGNGVPLTPATVLCLLYFHPLTIFLTMPRIMMEAWKIAYVKKLGVYQKPNPQHAPPLVPAASSIGASSNGAPVPPGKGRTIHQLPESSVDIFCKEIAFSHFTKLCKLAPLGTRLILHLRYLPRTLIISREGVISETSEPTPFPLIDESGANDSPDIMIHLSSPAFLTRLVLDAENTARAVSCAFVAGDWSAADANHIARFLQLCAGSLEKRRLQSQPDAHSGEPEDGEKVAGLGRSLFEWAFSSYLRFGGGVEMARFSSRHSEFPPFCAIQNTAGNDVFQKDVGQAITSMKPVSIVAEGSEWTLLRGVLELWAGEALFRSVTRFVVDPSLVGKRVLEVYSNADQNVNEAGDGIGKAWFEKLKAQNDTTRGWTLVGEFGDEVDILAKERYRYQVLKDCAGTV
ncbi:hypothetical protein BJ741DRAFT_194173 [Chytriomyces cf. hyalinus JEL632]|nr:hypothetical protein BJ741DRAFT_194173 [Chytriomyces cf. hyalinus JEL632]